METFSKNINIMIESGGEPGYKQHGNRAIKRVLQIEVLWLASYESCSPVNAKIQ